MTEKTLKNKLIKLGISEEEAERISEAKDILTKIENKLEIKDQSEHLATQADLLRLELRLPNKKDITNIYWILGIGLPIIIGLMTTFFTIIINKL